MRDHKLVGTTTGNSLELAADALGTPGVHAELSVCAMFVGDTEVDEQRRRSDASERPFALKALLGKAPISHHNLKANFGPEDGSSYIQAASQVAYFIVDSSTGPIRLDVNKAHEVSMASATIPAISPIAARYHFEQRLLRYLDRMSYLGGIPTHVIYTVAHDTKNEIQTIYYVAPPRPVKIDNGGEELHDGMKPVYALYRETMNSYGPYYRLLCLYKIIEGLLGPLRVDVRKRAKALGVDLLMDKDLVPDHPEFPLRFKNQIGTSIKTLADNVLAKEYRDAAAHFSLKRASALNVSSMPDMLRFSDAAFVADLCVRELIAKHDQYLARISVPQRLAPFA